MAFRDDITLIAKQTMSGGYRSLEVLHVAMARVLI